MNLIIISFLVGILSQTAKFIFRLFGKRKKNLKGALWVYEWAGGAPSTHSAVLAAAIYSIAYYEGYNLLFGFAVIVAAVFIYNLLAERTKEELEEANLKKRGPRWASKIYDDGRLLDISGHTFFEVISGIIFGLVMAFILNKVF